MTTVKLANEARHETSRHFTIMANLAIANAFCLVPLDDFNTIGALMKVGPEFAWINEMKNNHREGYNSVYPQGGENE